jgi:hypothetical protein
MLRAIQRLQERVLQREAFERARTVVRASPLARWLARNKQDVTDTLGWCGWVLAGGFVLFASWELIGFSDLMGHRSLRPAESHRPAQIESAPGGGASTGCTQATLNRDTGVTLPADCRSSLPGPATWRRG